jgi:hypothetical protein
MKTFPLPYTERHIPFKLRKGLKVWPHGARLEEWTERSVPFRA